MKVRRALSQTAAMMLIFAACDATEPGDRDGRPDTTPVIAADPDSFPAAPHVLAVTIDDLPWVGDLRPGSSRTDALHALIDTLVERDVPAAGFANCNRAGTNADALRTWIDAGLEIGNHTAAHRDLNDASLEQWLADARSCHDMLARITDQRPLFFRYPYLHQGPTAERQASALDLLREVGSPIAHVTIDNSDWILAVAYGDAITAGDSARAAAIGAAFVDHIIRAVLHYQDVARQKTGRDVPHVLLLHANLLVTDHIGTLLDRLHADHGFRFVSIAEAQRDPVYQAEDGYTGPGGLSWLYRMAPATPGMQAWDDAEAARLRLEWRD